MSTSTNPTFRLTLAPGFRSEQEYVARVLFTDFLGLELEVAQGSNTEPMATLAAGERCLCLPQTLFSGPDSTGAVGRAVPRPLGRLDLESTGLSPGRFCGPELPVLFGSPSRGAWITRGGQQVTLHADVLGSSFFMLTRLEEVGSPERDEHGCFPTRASLAWAEGFLTRPIVDEYAELLWLMMLELWPGLRRRPRRFAVRISHDVDRPWAYGDLGLRDRLWLVRYHARSGILPPLADSRLLNSLLALLGLPHRDPFDTFETLMEHDEAAGLKATFNFLCGGTTRHDGRYDVGSARMRRLLRAVHARGHEIGLHGSYDTIDDAPRLAGERQRLTSVLREEGIAADVVAGRQHYLRWRAPVTWSVWEEVGLACDSSLGFWDTIGFRCGTCHEYPVFDAVARRPLRVRERPLHLMDIALPQDIEASLAAIDALRRTVSRYDGVLEVLWHNNTLAERPDSAGLYRRAIARGEG